MKMKISHEKQILYVLPISNNNDEARGFRVYIYFPGDLESCHSLAKNNLVRVSEIMCRV